MKASILVPNSLKEVTLRQYRKFLKVEADVDIQSPFYMQKLVEIFCGIDLQDVANIRYKSLVDTATHIRSLFDQKSEFVQTFHMNGLEYGFIPVLDDISLGEYIDLDNYLSDQNNIHKAMAVLYRPISHRKEDRYDIVSYEGTRYADDYLDMPLDVAFGAYVFFWNLNKELVNATLNYLEMEEADSELKRILQENGGGIKAYMHSLRGILQELNISQN